MTLKRNILWFLVSAFLISLFMLVARIVGVPNTLINIGCVLISLAVLGYFLDEEKKEKERSSEAPSKDSNKSG